MFPYKKTFDIRDEVNRSYPDGQGINKNVALAARLMNAECFLLGKGVILTLSSPCPIRFYNFFNIQFLIRKNLLNKCRQPIKRIVYLN